MKLTVRGVKWPFQGHPAEQWQAQVEHRFPNSAEGFFYSYIHGKESNKVKSWLERNFKDMRYAVESHEI